MNKQEFRPIFQSLWNVYSTKKELDTGLLATWYQVLGTLPAATVEAAALEYMRGDSPFMPRPGQIYKLAMQQEGVTTSAAIGDADVDQTRGDMFALEWDYWHNGMLEPVSWERLIHEFENNGRQSAATHARDKYEYLKIDAGTP